jgi:hypothetical protein
MKFDEKIIETYENRLKQNKIDDYLILEYGLYLIAIKDYVRWNRAMEPLKEYSSNRKKLLNLTFDCLMSDAKDSFLKNVDRYQKVILYNENILKAINYISQHRFIGEIDIS